MKNFLVPFFFTALLIVGAGCVSSPVPVTMETPTAVAPTKVAELPANAPAIVYQFTTDKSGVHFSVNDKPSFTMQADAAKQFLVVVGLPNPHGNAVSLAQDSTIVYLSAKHAMYSSSGESIGLSSKIYAYSTKQGSLTEIYSDLDKNGDGLDVMSGNGTQIVFTRCNVDWSPGPNDATGAGCPPGTRWALDVSRVSLGLQSYKQ